jgi:hypothetical protein
LAWWQRKIVALLHDPPDKVLDIPGHEERARELVQKAFKLLEEEWKKAKGADRIASALDRIPFPSKLTVECDRVIHPLSAQEHPIALPSADQRETLQNLQNQVVENLLQGDDDKTRFLRLWRLFQEHLEQKAPSIPWALLPAGSVYAACYDLTERALGARKALRDFCDRSEPAGKCSLCGERQALSDLDAQVAQDWWEREKEFWSKVAKVCRRCGQRWKRTPLRHLHHQALRCQIRLRQRVAHLDRISVHRQHRRRHFRESAF